MILRYHFFQTAFNEDDDLGAKLKAFDRLSSENVDLMTKLKLVQHDKDRLQSEVDKVFHLYFVSSLKTLCFQLILTFFHST